jgi:hypothetical protein
MRCFMLKGPMSVPWPPHGELVEPRSGGQSVCGPWFDKLTVRAVEIGAPYATSRAVMLRRAATAAASRSSTPTVVSQPMQPSVIDWP